MHREEILGLHTVPGELVATGFCDRQAGSEACWAGQLGVNSASRVGMHRNEEGYLTL